MQPHERQTGTQIEADESADRAFGRNLLAPLLGLLGIGMLAGLFWSLGLADRQRGDGLSDCSSIVDGPQRLACYDKLSVAPQPGRGAFAPSLTHSQKGLQ